MSPTILLEMEESHTKAKAIPLTCRQCVRTVCPFTFLFTPWCLFPLDHAFAFVKWSIYQPSYNRFLTYLSFVKLYTSFTISMFLLPLPKYLFYAGEWSLQLGSYVPNSLSYDATCCVYWQRDQLVYVCSHMPTHVRFYNLLARHARFRVLQTIYVTHP